MELDNINVRIVSSKDPQRLMVVRCPQSRRPVVSDRREVVAVRRELDIPNRVDVPFVNDDTSPRLQAPQANRAIFRAGQQQRPVRTERDTVNGAGVTVHHFHCLGRFVVHHANEYVL